MDESNQHSASASACASASNSSTQIVGTRCGIYNTGNDCFMNASIQCLASCPFMLEFIKHYVTEDIEISNIFKKYDFLNDDDPNKLRECCEEILKCEDMDLSEDEKKIITHIAKKHDSIYLHIVIKDMIKYIIFKRDKTLNPKCLIDIGRNITRNKGFEHLFTGGQNDPHEFLAFILDILHNSKSRAVKLTPPIIQPTHTQVNRQYFAHYCKRYENDYSFFVKNFYYYMLNCVACGACGNKTWEMSPSDILCLPMPENVFSQEHINIYDCFKALFQAEKIDYKCEKCDNIENNHLEKKILTRPRTLIIKLKRYASVGSGLVKVTKFIEYPEFIELNKFSCNDKNYRYQLCGVINHIGVMNGGHYFSYTKELTVQKDKIEFENRWWECNDANIREIALESTVLNSPHAYMLFYSIVDE